ncbi:MAG: sigma factor-like helix-turn-helix DNA-binding protein [Nitrospinota bacterium]|nr:sigma factor-like helix-turn-helix DNA-binding protein [Nitrospinota bacterium]
MDDLTLEQFQLSTLEGFNVRPPRPEEVFEEKEGRTLLEAAIAKLPEEYRTVLVLRDVEGHSGERDRGDARPVRRRRKIAASSGAAVCPRRA